MDSDQRKIMAFRNNPLDFAHKHFGFKPDPWQEDYFKVLPSRDMDKIRISLQACVGPGKALSKDTILYTPEGRKRWGDLKRKDLIFAADGSQTKIKAIYDKGMLQMYRVTFSDDSFVECCEDHLWSVSESGRPDKWVTLSLKQLMDKGIHSIVSGEKRRRWKIPIQGAAQFKEASLSLDPYVLGVWLGDGSANKAMYTKPDIEVVEEILSRGYNVRSVGIDHTIREISKDLKLLGLLDKRSYERFIPEEYKVSSSRQRLDLLKGLMDTDGTIDRDGCMEYSTTSRRLADDIIYLVRSLGGMARERKPKQGNYINNRVKIDCRPCFRISVCLAFNPFNIKRKSMRWSPPQERYLTRYIKSVKKIEIKDAMCIEVEHALKTHLTNDFIVTHNTAVLALTGWWFLSVWGRKGNHPKGAAVSVTHDNLKDNLWPEFAKWRGRSEYIQRKFEWTKERIHSKEHPETWFISARTWSKKSDPEEQGRTLSGLHSDYVLVLLDESGEIPVAVLKAGEQALSTNPYFGKIVQAGNPSSLDGILYAAASELAHLWHVIRITGDPDDPKRSPRIDIEWAREQIRTYGRDNPWIMYSILGLFPPSSINALLGPDEVRAAMSRHIKEDVYSWSQKRLGVDVARFGDDRCFDDITEILTNEGWKLFSDLHGNEKVLSVPANGKASEWGPINHIHKAPFDGELNLLETRSLNFAITDNHRMLVRTNPKSEVYKFESYKNLPKDFVIREGNSWAGSNPIVKEFESVKQMPHGGFHKRTDRFSFYDWAEFLGWFVSEGNVYIEKREGGRKRIIITQYPGPKRLAIEGLLTRMQIKWRACSNGTQIEFSNNVIGEYLINYCGVGARNKKVPDEIKNGDEITIKKFLDAFLLGDGHARADGFGRHYVTSSKRLADDIQEMLAKIGRAGAIKAKNLKGSKFFIEGREANRKNDTYVVYERSFCSGKWVKKSDVQKIPYKGFVWCVATTHESIYVRRKGIPMWSGNTVIFPRQGLAAFKFIEMRGATTPDIAARVMLAKNKWRSDAEFVDGTGGFGAGVVDNLRVAGYSPFEVNFSSKALDPKYYNKRSEMWFLLSEAVKAGLVLPNDPQLVKELTAPTYTLHNGKLRLEEKDQIKKRLGFSPDIADALALTYALPDMPAENELLKQFDRAARHRTGSDEYYGNAQAIIDYDPYSRDN